MGLQNPLHVKLLRLASRDLSAQALRIHPNQQHWLHSSFKHRTSTAETPPPLKLNWGTTLSRKEQGRQQKNLSVFISWKKKEKAILSSDWRNSWHQLRGWQNILHLTSVLGRGKTKRGTEMEEVGAWLGYSGDGDHCHQISLCSVQFHNKRKKKAIQQLIKELWQEQGLKALARTSQWGEMSAGNLQGALKGISTSIQNNLGKRKINKIKRPICSQ